MSDENIVYVKIKNGIFKCYKSEQMHKPIYYPVESKTNGYIDYNDVEKILTIEDLYQENQELKKQLEEYQEELEKADSITQSCIFNGKKESEISYRKCLNMLEKHKNQQKKFIEWLEVMNRMYQNEYKDIDAAEHYNCILQKYKSIMGDDK